MTWTLIDSGTTASLTLNTPVTLSTQTTNATYCLMVDCSNMVLLDVTEIRVLSFPLTGGAQTQVWKDVIQGALVINFLRQSPFIPSDQSIQFTIVQLAGTGRTYKWKVLSQ